MLGSGLDDRAAEGVAGHHDDVVALVNSALDHSHTVGGVVAGGLEVGELDLVGIGKRLAGLVGGLVEGLVGDITVVGDHGDLIGRLVGVALVVIGLGIVLLIAAGDQGQRHNQSQDHSKKLLHGYSTFLIFLFSRLAAGKPVSRHGEALPPVPCAL